MGRPVIRAFLFMTYTWKRRAENGYEVSSAGDSRFSALYAKLRDGRTIEEAYQLDVKGYRKYGKDWRLGKGRPAIYTDVDLWAEYLNLWRAWADQNPALLRDLANRAIDHGILTDRYASGPINQARALAQIINETLL